MSKIESLTKTSYTTSIENIKNQVDMILDMTPNISDKFEYKDFELLEKINMNIKKTEKIMRQKNFDNKVKQSRPLKILTSVHSIKELDYDRYIVHCQPIHWNMWDKFIDIIKDVHPEIEWNKYSELDVLLCVFLWCSFRGPNYYNKNIKKENEPELPNMRPGHFGSIEFFITIDGYNKNFMPIPIDLLKTISINTHGSLYFKPFQKALKYIQDERIRIIRIKYQYTYRDDDIYGLKVEDYNDFVKINYPNEKENKYKDWIQYGEDDGYVKKYNNKKRKKKN